MTPEKMVDFIIRNGDKLIEIVSQYVPVRGVALNDERGLLNVSVSVGSLRRIAAETGQDQVPGTSNRTFGRQPLTRKRTFDSREEEEVNETASDQDLDDLDLSSDESRRNQAEIKERLKAKKAELRKAKKNHKKFVLEREKEQESAAEEEEGENSEEVVERPPEKKDHKETVKPDKNIPNDKFPKKEDSTKSPEIKKSNLASQKSFTNQGESLGKARKRDGDGLPSSKDPSSKKIDAEPSHPLDRNQGGQSVNDRSKNRKEMTEESEVNTIKVVLKENDKDIIQDPKTGASYQKMPNGEFSELKKVTVVNDDGKKETVFINPNIDPSLSKKTELSRDELQGLKVIEDEVNPISPVLSKIARPLQKFQNVTVQDPDLSKRLQRQATESQRSPISKRSSRPKHQFEFQDEESEESEPRSDDSEEEAIELQIIDKNKDRSKSQFSEHTKEQGSKRSVTKVKEKESTYNKDENIKHDNTERSVNPLEKSSQEKPLSNLSKLKSIMPFLKNKGSRNDWDNKLRPTMSGPAFLANKSEVNSQEMNEGQSFDSLVEGKKPASIISKFSRIGENSTMLRPRTSKLEEAKNLKVPISFKGGQSRVKEMVYTPNSGPVSTFDFKGHKNIDGKVQEISLPQAFFDGISQMMSPALNPSSPIGPPDRNNAPSENGLQFMMDKDKLSSMMSARNERDVAPKTINRLQEGTVESSEPRKRPMVPQFETLLSDDFFCDDILMTFTIILEYLRRFVFLNEAISERMDILFLGQFQHQKSESIAFEDLEYIMQTYNVFITKTELESLFNFFDYEDKGEIKLSEIHDSLVSFLQIYETITFEFYDGFKELHKKIKEVISLEEFKDYLIENSEKFHMRNEHLKDYIESYLELHSPAVMQTVTTCGDFLFFDQSYIFNVLNYLLFIEHYVGEKISFEYVNALHHYQKFRSLVEVKLVFLLLEAYKVANEDKSQLRVAMQSRHEKVLPNYAHKISFKQFRQLLKDVKLGDVTVWESMILFKTVLDQSKAMGNEDLNKFSTVSPEKCTAYIESLTYDKRNTGNNITDSQAGQSLLIEKHKKKMSQVTGEKFVYTYDINVETLDDVHLARCDYSDLTVMYQFPGEAEPIESGIITYIPEEHSNLQ